MRSEAGSTPMLRAGNAGRRPYRVAGAEVLNTGPAGANAAV